MKAKHSPMRPTWLLLVSLGLGLATTHQAHAFEPSNESAPKKALHPKKVEDARQHFTAGLKAYEEGRYPNARDEFDKAYALAPSYKLLYNQGLVYRQLDDPARAIRFLELYLTQGGWEVSDARVAE